MINIHFLLCARYSVDYLSPVLIASRKKIFMMDVGHPVLQSCHRKLVSSILTETLPAGGGVIFF